MHTEPCALIGHNDDLEYSEDTLQANTLTLIHLTRILLYNLPTLAVTVPRTVTNAHQARLNSNPSPSSCRQSSHGRHRGTSEGVATWGLTRSLPSFTPPLINLIPRR